MKEQTINQQDWDKTDHETREKFLLLSGWVTSKGYLSLTGKKIIKQNWNELSPAARKILSRFSFSGKTIQGMGR